MAYIIPVGHEPGGFLKKILLPILISTPAYSANYPLDTFCQDVNTAIQKIQVHSLNIANIKTTRTSQGGHFKRILIKSCHKGHCVITEDNSSPLLVYNPEHPDAKENGYVAFPSFSLEEEQAGLDKAKAVYEIIFRVHSFDAKELLAGHKYDQCLKRYSYFREYFDYKSYLGR